MLPRCKSVQLEEPVAEIAKAMLRFDLDADYESSARYRDRMLITGKARNPRRKRQNSTADRSGLGHVQQTPITIQTSFLLMTNTISEAAQLKIIPLIAKELGVGLDQVKAAVALLDEGATVPFIARYRKEVTGNLDDTHCVRWKSGCCICGNSTSGAPRYWPPSTSRASSPRNSARYYRGRRDQTPLEDVYLPYKPKRRTRRRLRSRPGWSRWPMACSPIRGSIPIRKLRSI